MRLGRRKRRQVYFFHIPKTAGSSVHDFLRRYVTSGRVSAPLLWDDLVDRKSADWERADVISGHFGGLLPLWLRTWPRIITMLREPVARSLSHINHVQRDPAHPLHSTARGLSIIEYCRHELLKHTVQDFQARSLATLELVAFMAGDPGSFGARSVRAEQALECFAGQPGLVKAASRALERMEGVGICEAHGRSLDLFAKVLNLELSGHQTGRARPRVNIRPHHQRGPEELTAKERETLERATSVDRRVYEAAVLKFEAQCDRHQIPVPTVETCQRRRSEGSSPTE